MGKILKEKWKNAPRTTLLLIALAAVVFSVTAVGYALSFNEITIYGDGEVHTLQTRAETVEEALLEGEIQYIEEDLIQPHPDKEIHGDMTVYIRRAVSVTIYDEEEKHEILTAKTRVQDALEEKGISFVDEDLIHPGLNHGLTDGIVISIRRAQPFEVHVDGEELSFFQPVKDVEEALEIAEVTLEEEDELNLALETTVMDDMIIEITRIERETIVESREIDFKTIRKNDNSRYKGSTRVSQEGSKGMEEFTIEITYEDGEEVSREVIEREVVKEPVNRVIQVGTKSLPPANTLVTRGGTEVTRRLTVEATAYSQYDPGVTNRTATGATLRKGIIAVDPRVIPLGTRIYVPGYGEGVAADVGGAIKGYRIDLAFESRAEALRYGRRTVTIKIYD